MQSCPGYKLVCLGITASVLSMITFAASAYTSFAYEKQASQNPMVQETLTLDIAGQVNPEGIRLTADGLRRWVRLKDDDGEPTRYLQAGSGLAVSPAYAILSLHGEWQPAVFLNLHIEYDLIRYLGAYTGLLSFPDRKAKFGDDELDALDGSEETATGQKFSLQPSVYARAGKVIIINESEVSYYLFSGKGPYFLELEYDTLLKNGDYLIRNSTSFFILVSKGRGASEMYLGPFYEIVRAHDSGLTRQKAGGQFYWVISDTGWGMKKPRIYGQADYAIEDRNRQGELHLAMGFGFDFDL